MSRRLDVINLGDPEQNQPKPAMPSACESGGCGGPEPLIPPPPTFGEVFVNGRKVGKAPTMAWPCGSRISGLSMTSTRMRGMPVSS